jgi:glutaredoxin
MLVIMEYQAEIYTKKTCKHCNLAKKLLAQHNISYQEYIIGGDPHLLTENQQVTTRESLLERCPDARTVPQIWLDGQHIGGAEELEQYFTGVDRQENHQ